MDDLAPKGRVSTWLASFGAALERRDIPAVLALFDDDCYWRDLVTFTWNIYTAEGKEAGRIDVPARPLQLLFGGPDRRTLFILTHHALYSARP